MLYLIIKAVVSGLLVVAVSETAKRYPGLGGLIASLPLVSVLGMIWLWRDTHDPARMSDILEVPDSWRFIGYFCLGYPQNESDQPELERAGWEQRRSSQACVLRR